MEDRALRRMSWPTFILLVVILYFAGKGIGLYD